MLTKIELKKIPLLNKQIEDKKRIIEMLHEQAYSLGALDYGDRVHGTMSNMGHPAIDKIDKIIDLENALQKDIENLIKLKLEFIKMLGQLSCAEKKIMELRYLEDLKWNAIAKKMDYSLQNVFKIHSKSLNKLFIEKDKE